MGLGVWVLIPPSLLFFAIARLLLLLLLLLLLRLSLLLLLLLLLMLLLLLRAHALTSLFTRGVRHGWIRRLSLSLALALLARPFPPYGDQVA